MQNIMRMLREKPPRTIGKRVVKDTLDYSMGLNGLPKANVLEFRLEGGGKAMVRPSGTEPKMKLYVFSRESSMAGAREALQKIRSDMERYLQ